MFQRKPMKTIVIGPRQRDAVIAVEQLGAGPGHRQDLHRNAGLIHAGEACRSGLLQIVLHRSAGGAVVACGPAARLQSIRGDTARQMGRTEMLQLGGASCRGRVCQLGWLSGVAGSSKKNTSSKPTTAAKKFKIEAE